MTDAPIPAVRAVDLTRTFGAFTAVNAVSFEAARGEIFGFLGANGAGKTTTIRMLCGLLKPTGGEAWVNGFNIATESKRVKRTIGYMSQKFSLYGDLTVMENLSFYGGIYRLTAAEVRERSLALLEKVGLARRRNELTADIPLGFKQRLALGCAVLHRPQVVFLDEPTSGVDPAARRRFWDLIYELADGGTTVFVTTHYMDEAEYCGRVIVMKDGRIIAAGPPGALKRAHQVKDMQSLFFSLVKS